MSGLRCPSTEEVPLDTRNWHDNAVHGLSFRNPSEVAGTSTLVLDIDHILEWIQVGRSFEFIVVPALLRFHGCFKFKMTVDYSNGPIAVEAFSIDGIERTIAHTQYGECTTYRIPINSPSGVIEFEATSWSLEYTGEPVRSSQMSLPRQDSQLDV